MQERRKKTFLLFLLSCLPYGVGLNFAFSFVESQCSWRSIQNHESAKLGKLEKTKTETNKECRKAGRTHFCFSCFPAFLMALVLISRFPSSKASAHGGQYIITKARNWERSKKPKPRPIRNAGTQEEDIFVFPAFLPSLFLS